MGDYIFITQNTYTLTHTSTIPPLRKQKASIIEAGSIYTHKHTLSNKYTLKCIFELETRIVYNTHHITRWIEIGTLLASIIHEG